MTDPSTLFLSAPQVRPSWTLNGLTLELNLAPAHVSSNDLQTAVGDSMFAVTQSASFLSTSSLNGGVPAVSNASTVTNALLPSNPVVEQNVSQMNNCAGFYVSSVTTAGTTIEDALKKPVFLASSTGQQVSESAEKKKRQKVIAEGSSNTADDECTAAAETKSNDQAAAAPKKMTVGTPCQVAEITTSVVNEIRDNLSVAGTTQATTIVSAAPITTTSVIASVPASKIATSSVPITANAGALASNNGIPVGIAVARQRYVSSTTCKSQTQNLKETINTSSTSSPFASSVPYQPLIESYTPGISNIVSGVVAGTTGCDDRSIANIGGNILPSIIAWPQQQQQQQHHHHAIQPSWYPYASAMETVTPNVSPGNYQLVRDPVGGHIMLIPSNQIGSTQSTASASFATTTNQQLQSFLVPQHFQQQQQQHSHQSHSLFLDHLVSVVPSSTNIKQNSVSTLLKLHDGVLTGVMMPCDLGKSSSVVNPTQTTATIGQQLLSANNSSISLVHQFNSSNIHNPNMNAPHHFSSISSSGSLLIQQISGNAGQSPLMNHHINNSVVIAESTAMQSVINTQPTYPANNAPYLMSTPVSTTENSSSAAVNQLQPSATCIVSNSSQQTATFSQLPPSINDLAKPTIVQSKIVNIEKQVNIETKLTDANDQTWPSQSTAQILVEKTEENAVIKIDTNSIVQDASNQTEDNDDKDDEEYTNGETNDSKNGSGVDEERESESVNDIDSSLSDRVDLGRKSKMKQDDKAATSEKIIYNDANPDFMGLQLLLNGIEAVEHSGNVTTNAEEEDNAIKGDTTNTSDSDKERSAPNPLEILCALADQRIKEEKKSESSDFSPDEDDFCDEKMLPLKNSKINYSRKHDLSQSSEVTRSEPDSRRFLSKHKRHRLPPLDVCDTDPLQMRLELAKLQKKYRETRKELNRLTHNRKRGRSSSRTRSPSSSNNFPPICDIKSDVDTKTVKRKPGRPRKSCDPSVDAKGAKCGGVVDNIDLPAKSTIRPMKRPRLKLDTTQSYGNGCTDDLKVSNENNGDLSPPVLEPMCTPPKTKSFKSEVLSPPTLVANKILYLSRPKGLLPDDNERLWPSEFENKPLYHRLSGDDLSDEDTFKRKEKPSEPTTTVKRKVGRPRKYPKEDAPPSIESSKNLKPSVYNKKNALTLSHKSNEKQIPVTSSVVSTFAMLKSQRDTSLNAEIEHKPRITPKLKAEAKFKTWRQKSPEICRDALDLNFLPKKRKIVAHDDLLTSDRSGFRDKQCHSTKGKLSAPLGSNSSVSNPSKLSLPSQTVANTSTKSSSVNTVARSTKSSLTPTEYTDEDFVLTPKLLDESEKQPLRVLLPVSNLFRAGELSAVSPPDLYGIKLDGERRTQAGHIYSKEDVLRDVVLEVRGKYPLRIGTRVCAFWSSQYHCLYPGNVTSFSSLDEPEDEDYTAVEFDDGDSGRIKMSKIRVLPQSIAKRKDVGDESEALGKRKRRISSVSFDEIPVDKQLHSPDRLSCQRHKIGAQNTPPSTSAEEPNSQSLDSANSDAEKPTTSGGDSMDKKKNGERKKLKKKHKDKMRDNSDSSCKRKSHKHRSDTDDGSVKKRHKHKHKHHKHHKRKRSHDTDRCESDSHFKCSSKSHGKANKVDKLLNEDSDWTSVPPYSSHLTEGKKSETKTPKEKTESTPSSLKVNAKKSSNQSKVDEGEVNDEKKNAKKLREDGEGEPEKVEIKRIRHRKSVDHSASKDNEMNVVEEDTNGTSSSSTIDSASVHEKNETVVTEQPDSPPSEETDDASSSSRRGSDSTSDSESSSTDKYWEWHGKGSKRNGKGRGRKEFYKSIKRGDVVINVGDCAVFLTAGSSARPFIGKIETMWESYGNMMVRVKWFYHPEETTGLTKELPYLGALFESPHNDSNEVQTISHKCDVISLSEYRERLKKEPERIHNVYESNDLYYLAGYYDPTAKRLEFKEEIFT